MRIGGLWSNKPVLFAIVICTTVLLAVAHLVYEREIWVESDDATVQGHFIVLGAPVAGTVQKVLVEGQQRVKKGQLLCELDDRRYRYALVQAEQQLGSTRAVWERAREDFRRSLELSRGRVIPRQRFVRDRNRFLGLDKELKADEARVEAARVNLGYTRVVAPADGVIAVRTAQPGMELKKGDPLFGIVYPQRKWVTARIKETDLSDIRVGEAAEVTVDAIPDRTFSGTIESVSPSTEGQFAAIPPDTAAGNYTKYVQRVPVRVALNLAPDETDFVRVGLSANVRIRRIR